MTYKGYIIEDNDQGVPMFSHIFYLPGEPIYFAKSIEDAKQKIDTIQEERDPGEVSG